MAKFFKSAWFKCTAVLLAIAVISGGLLALLNDVLYVSPEERTGRALQKIYDKALTSDEYDVILDVDSGNTAIAYDFGQIEKIFIVGEEDEEHDLLFKTTGNEGYKGGTVPAV